MHDGFRLLGLVLGFEPLKIHLLLLLFFISLASVPCNVWWP
jgi:hypothetical protein